jgi:hypothetical protein
MVLKEGGSPEFSSKEWKNLFSPPLSFMCVTEAVCNIEDIPRRGGNLVILYSKWGIHDNRDEEWPFIG